MLILLGFLCPLLYMRIVLSGILNGMGFQSFIFQNSLLSSATLLCFIYFLTPIIGVNAYILGWFVSIALVYFLEIEKLRQCTGLRLDFYRWFLAPAICAACAGTLARLAVDRLPLADGAAGLVVSALLFGAIYLLFATGMKLLPMPLNMRAAA